jgi:hypothetical protein
VLLADDIDDIGFTGASTLVVLADQLAGRNIVFAIATPTRIIRPEFDRFGLTDAIGSDYIFPTLDNAITAFRNT